MLTLLRKLYRTGLLTPGGVYYLLEAVLTTGINLMALLRLAARLHPQRTAVVDTRERLNYRQLWQQAETLAVRLAEEYGIRQGWRVAIATRNHAATIKAIFAISRLGAHVFLVNPEMSADQVLALSKRLRFDFYIYDPEQQKRLPVFEQLGLANKTLPTYHPTAVSVDQLARQQTTRSRLKKVKPGNIVIMTGGTTGQPKPASRKPSALAFLPPFIALLCQVHLDRYRSLYIATPIYHGFGLSALLIGVVLGAELYITQRFDAKQACDLIVRYDIQVVTLVPLMLQRMLNHDAESLMSLQRILTGGALLKSELATNTLHQLGPILFDLYGTSEAGFCIMATPDLLRRKPASIGQPLPGVQAKVVTDGDKIGCLCIRSAWSVNRKRWIETGDLACLDNDGDIFLYGRVDDMIVSGGENVYPTELETVLLQHPDIDTAAVIGIADEEFGQRLKAIVVSRQQLNDSSLRDWLKPRVARYQMPAIIEFRKELPYTTLGKLNKKELRHS